MNYFEQLLRHNKFKYLFRIVQFILLAIVWDLMAHWVHNPKLMPDLMHIFTISLPSIARFSGEVENNLGIAIQIIIYHSVYSLLRLLVGLLMGIIVGYLVGLGIHFIRFTRQGNAIILNIIRAVPLFALIPLFLHWFGGNEIGIYLYITFAVSVVVATNVYESVLNISTTYIQQAVVLGATHYQIFKTVLFPAIQPQMVGSLRYVLGVSWAFSLGAEYLAGSKGLGYLCYQSYIYADMGKLIIFAMIYAFYGWISFSLTKKTLFLLKQWDNT